MVDDFTIILKQQQLEELQKLAEAMNAIPPFHIYMIIKRPRIFFDSVVLDKKYLIGKYKIQEKDNFKTIDFMYEHNFKDKDLSIICEYPYEQLFIINKKGEKVFGGYAFLILQELNKNSCIYQDESEIVYNGKSFGEDGKGEVYGRIKSHSTLQRIYSDNTP